MIIVLIVITLSLTIVVGYLCYTVEKEDKWATCTSGILSVMFPIMLGSEIQKRKTYDISKYEWVHCKTSFEEGDTIIYYKVNPIKE